MEAVEPVEAVAAAPDPLFDVLLACCRPAVGAPTTLTAPLAASCRTASFLLSTALMAQTTKMTKATPIATLCHEKRMILLNRTEIGAGTEMNPP